MTIGYNVVSVKVVQQSAVPLNVFLFSGTRPADIVAPTRLDATSDAWSLGTRASAVVKNTEALTVVNQGTVLTVPVTTSALTVRTGSAGYNYTTPGNTNFKADRRINLSQLSFSPAVSRPVVVADNTSDNYSTAVRFLFKPQSAFNLTQTTAPVSQPRPLTVLARQSNYVVSSNVTYNITQSTTVGSAPSSLPIFNISNSTDVTIVTSNTGSTASYSFIPRYTTSTTVNVAPSSYATLSTTNQQSIAPTVLNLMYSVPVIPASIYPTGIGLTYQTRYTGSGTIGILSIINGKSFISSTSAFIRNWNSGYQSVRFTAERSTWLYMNNSTIDVEVDSSTTDTYVLKGYSAPIKTLVARSETITEIDPTVVAFDVDSSTSDQYQVKSISTTTPVRQDGVVETQSAVNGPVASLTVPFTRSYVYLLNTRASATVSNKFDTNRTNYISTNTAGINIISVYVYEPVYGGLTPPISSTGEFGGVQSGVLGYQYWT